MFLKLISLLSSGLSLLIALKALSLLILNAASSCQIKSRKLHKRDLLQVVEGHSVVGPLENDLVLELNGVLLLVDVDELHQDHRDVDGHSHDGVIGLARGGDGGNPPLKLNLTTLRKT